MQVPWQRVPVSSTRRRGSPRVAAGRLPLVVAVLTAVLLPISPAAPVLAAEAAVAAAGRSETGAAPLAGASCVRSGGPPPAAVVWRPLPPVSGDAAAAYASVSVPVGPPAPVSPSLDEEWTRERLLTAMGMSEPAVTPEPMGPAGDSPSYLAEAAGDVALAETEPAAATGEMVRTSGSYAARRPGPAPIPLEESPVGATAEWISRGPGQPPAREVVRPLPVEESPAGAIAEYVSLGPGQGAAREITRAIPLDTSPAGALSEYVSQGSEGPPTREPVPVVVWDDEPLAALAEPFSTQFAAAPLTVVTPFEPVSGAAPFALASAAATPTAAPNSWEALAQQEQSLGGPTADRFAAAPVPACGAPPAPASSLGATPTHAANPFAAPVSTPAPTSTPASTSTPVFATTPTPAATPSATPTRTAR